METEILYRYVGPDMFPGIPAADLTQADFDRLPILRQLDVKANASYELVEQKADENPTEQTKADKKTDSKEAK